MTSPPSYDDPFLSVDDVAAIFDVKAATVRGWLRDGVLKGVKANRGPWRIQQSEVTRLAQERHG